MEPTTGKSFWAKPEGKAGMIGLIALGFGALVLWEKIAPVVVAMLANTLTAIVLLVAIIAIVWIAYSYHKLFTWAFRLLMRKLTELVITIDPIGVMKEYLSKLRKNWQSMQDEIGKVRGVRIRMEDEVNAQKRATASAVALMQRADKEQNKMQKVLLARKAGRAQDLGDASQPRTHC
ncbi:MAG: hypothetical protein ACP5N7_05450 [Candidatus Pacearchaeota archaeon]